MNKISLEQKLASVTNKDDTQRFLLEQSYEYKSVFIHRIRPDSTNPRFFPSIMISNIHAYQMQERKITKNQLVELYDSQNKVLIGKGCIVNCFERGTNEWKKANKSIESIMELAGNVAVSEIIQVPTIFPLENDEFQILTGHRRFFALVFANGVDTAAHFKVYDSCPLLPKTKQFQENASREELPQYGKLQAFEDALQEIEILNEARRRAGNKTLSVRESANILGISLGAYDNYNVLTRYPAVAKAYAEGCSTAFVPMKKLVLSIESEYKETFQKSILNLTDKKNINERIRRQINGESIQGETQLTKAPHFELKKINSVRGLQTLLTTDVTSLNTGINWTELDWDDTNTVSMALIKVVEYLNQSSLVD